MEFISLDISYWLLLIPAALAVLAAVILVLGIAIDTAKSKRGEDTGPNGGPWGTAFRWTGGLMLIALVATVIVSASQEESRKEEYKLAIQSSIEDRYGIELTQDQIEDLDYPAERPDSDSRAFGSTVSAEKNEDGNLLRRELFLLWDGDELQIASPGDDGKILPLAPQG